jgi:hypothetical protein
VRGEEGAAVRDEGQHLGDLTALTSLLLDQNDFEGEIPTALGR